MKTLNLRFGFLALVFSQRAWAQDESSTSSTAPTTTSVPTTTPSVPIPCIEAASTCQECAVYQDRCKWCASRYFARYADQLPWGGICTSMEINCEDSHPLGFGVDDFFEGAGNVLPPYFLFDDPDARFQGHQEISFDSSNCSDTYSPQETVASTCEQCLQFDGAGWCRLIETESNRTTAAVCIRDALTNFCNVDIIPFVDSLEVMNLTIPIFARVDRTLEQCNETTVITPAPPPQPRCEENLNCEQCNKGGCNWCGGVFEFNVNEFVDLGWKRNITFEYGMFGKCVESTTTSCDDVQVGNMEELFNLGGIVPFESFSVKAVPEDGMACSSVDWPQVYLAKTKYECSLLTNPQNMTGWCQLSSPLLFGDGGICTSATTEFVCSQFNVTIGSGLLTLPLIQSEYTVFDMPKTSTVSPTTPSPSGAASLKNLGFLVATVITMTAFALA